MVGPALSGPPDTNTATGPPGRASIAMMSASSARAASIVMLGMVARRSPGSPRDSPKLVVFDLSTLFSFLAYLARRRRLAVVPGESEGPGYGTRTRDGGESAVAQLLCLPRRPMT